MAVTPLKGLDDLGPDDIVRRQKDARRGVADPHDTYKTETVVVDFGTVTKGVVLKYPVGGTFVFAVYADNPPWHKNRRGEWEEAATEALNKFCAMRNLLFGGVKHEVTNTYNLCVELMNGSLE